MELVPWFGDRQAASVITRDISFATGSTLLLLFRPPTAERSENRRAERGIRSHPFLSPVFEPDDLVG